MNATLLTYLGRYAAIGAAAALAGCSGGSPTPVTATTKDIVAHPSGATLPDVSYDAASDTVTLSLNNVAYATLARNAGYDQGPFKGYYDGASVVRIASSPSGDLTVQRIAANPAIVATDRLFGTRMIRASDGTIPGSGRATFTGGYYGEAYLSSAGNAIITGITGDARLTADFGAGTVSGAISNRQFTAPTTPRGDVTLATGAIDANGGFTGTASGGGFSGSSSVTDTVTGNYRGLFGGTDGSEAVTGLALNHVLSSPGTPDTRIFETGAFIATK